MIYNLVPKWRPFFELQLTKNSLKLNHISSIFKKSRINWNNILPKWPLCVYGRKVSAKNVELFIWECLFHWLNSTAHSMQCIRYGLFRGKSVCTCLAFTLKLFQNLKLKAFKLMILHTTRLTFKHFNCPIQCLTLSGITLRSYDLSLVFRAVLLM